MKFIYNMYFGQMSYYIRNNSGTTQDAEDIFQEVVVAFIELVQHNKFRGDATVKTFLYSLTRNMWLNELKKRDRAQVRDQRFGQEQDPLVPHVQDYIAGREMRMQIMQIITRLGEACKKILLLFYYENLSMKEILTQTDYENEQVLRNKKYKCMKELEKMVTGDPALVKTLKTALQYGQ